VLAASQYGPDLQIQRMLRRAGRSFSDGLPVLEINPRHPLIRKLAGRVAANTTIAEKAGPT
jgi:molecular chaperone HtpG